MNESGGSLPSDRGALKERGTWVGQQLGEGWTEVEPGIYRFDAGVPNEVGLRLASPTEPSAE